MRKKWPGSSGSTEHRALASLRTSGIPHSWGSFSIWSPWGLLSEDLGRALVPVGVLEPAGLLPGGDGQWRRCLQCLWAVLSLRSSP